MSEATDRIVAALQQADIVPMAMALLQLQGDTALLERVAPHVKGPWAHQAELPQSLCQEIRGRMRDELVRLAAGGKPRLPIVEPALLHRMLGAAVGEPVPAEYIPMISEQIAFRTRDEAACQPQQHTSRARGGEVDAVIVGAGVSGLCAAVQLLRAGLKVVVFDKNDDVGGTWFDNRYPGCAVDTPNHFYEYSFAPNDDWPAYFSRREDIQAYLAGVADRYGLRRHIRFGREVVAARFDDARGTWRVETRERGGQTHSQTARFLITAVGQLSRPAYPAIDGLDRFAGEVVHTAKWQGDPVGHNRRVGLIGTGASAIQVGPGIVDRVARLTVFQRSSPWIMRNRNIHRQVSEGKKWALRTIPFYGNWYRFQLFWAFADGLYAMLQIDPDWPGGSRSVNARNQRIRQSMVRYLERKMAGRPDLMAKLLPDYPPYGKRVLADCGWYDMLLRDHVDLETTPIARIEPRGVRLKDGRLAALDALVLATGFEAACMLWPMHIVGRDGVTIRDRWGDDNPSAYLGMTVPDFPNLFVMYGPNTGLGHGGSVMFLAECQTRYILNCIALTDRSGGHSIEVRREVHDAYIADIDEQMKGFVWSHPSVTSWYKNAGGRIIINQPGRLVDYWNRCSTIDPSDYRIG